MTDGELLECAQLRVEVEQLRSELGLMRTELEEAKGAMAGYSERLAPRMGNLEMIAGKHAAKMAEHDRIFRALGADMMLRATGAGSVAPSGPIIP